MQRSELRDAVRELVVAVGALLTHELETGAELPFDVLEEGGGDGRRRGPVLYRYRPLTGEFVTVHWAAARELEAYSRACDALGSGAGPYLRHRGLRGSDPDAALLDVVTRVFEDATSFDLPEERLARIHAELEATLEGSTVRARVVAPLYGVRIASARVEVADGLALARRASAGSPPSELEGSARLEDGTSFADDDRAEPSPLDVFCVFERVLPIEASMPVDETRVAFRRVLTSLRLCGAGGTALGPLAWARADRGAWHPVALGVSARSRQESWELASSEESELRELLEILTLSRHGGRVGWALARFEMGCERVLETEALSDYLLGLRALLGEAEGSGDELLAERLAALCAAAEEREDSRATFERALALERRLMFESGGAAALESPRPLVRDVERSLRALLRDVLCGYLDEDLRGLADDLRRDPLPPDDAPQKIRIEDARVPDEDVHVAEEDTAEFEAVEPSAVEIGAVTSSIDWESS